MTGYTVHSGTTIKFSEGWDRVFQDGATQSKGTGKKATSRGAAKSKAKARVKRAAKKKR